MIYNLVIRPELGLMVWKIVYVNELVDYVIHNQFTVKWGNLSLFQAVFVVLLTFILFVNEPQV